MLYESRYKMQPDYSEICIHLGHIRVNYHTKSGANLPITIHRISHKKIEFLSRLWDKPLMGIT